MTDTSTAALARIRQMTDYWEQHLPEVIRTPAVVSALRAAMEPAAVAPPADQTAPHGRRERYAVALYNTLETSPFHTPWEDLGPLRRTVWYARAEAAMAAADAEHAVVAPPADRDALRQLAEAALSTVEAALGDTLLPAAREEALAGIVAVLPPPADRAEIRRLGLMVDEYATGVGALTDKLKRARDLHRETCPLAKGDVRSPAFKCGMCEILDASAAPLRRMADETAATVSPAATVRPGNRATGTQPEPCAHCGQLVSRITGTLAAWWVHDPGGNTVCHPEQAASSPRATPKPGAEAECTCADAGASFAPAGHYADCPAAGARQDGAQS